MGIKQRNRLVATSYDFFKTVMSTFDPLEAVMSSSVWADCFSKMNFTVL